MPIIVYQTDNAGGGSLPDLGVGYVRSLGGGDFTAVTVIPVTHGGTGLTSFSTGDMIYCSDSNTLSALSGNATTDRMFLSQVGDGITPDAPAWATLSSADVGLGNVENTAISTWPGSANITTLGTIISGEWNGSAIEDGYIASSSTWNDTADIVTAGAASWDDAYTLALAAEPAIAAGLTSQYWRGDKTWQTLNKAAVGLGNVENTALSTWGGTANIVLVGTIATGTWEATPIADAYIDSAVYWDAKLDDALADGKVFIGNAGGVATARDISGDATISNLGALTLATVATAGTTGATDKTLSVTINAKGLVTTISAALIAIAQSQVTGLVSDLAAINTTLSGLGTASTLAYDTDGTLAANSDARLATQKATKTYIDNLLSASDAMVFRGAIDCSANPNYPAANAGDIYRISVAGKIGGASGINVEIGDTIYCITDSSASGNQATVGSNWVIVQTNIDGAVVGPSSVTDSRIALFDGTTGRLIKQATVGISDLEPAIAAGTTAQYWRGDKSWQTLDKSAVGLGNVENTALSTWAGTTNLTTAGDLTVNELNLNDAGTAGDLAINYSGTGFFFPGPTDIAFVSSGSEKWRMVSNGAMVWGYSTTLAVGQSAYTPTVHYHATGLAASQAVSRWSADAIGPVYVLTKSRSATIGAFSAVQADDELGRFVATGDDGSDLQNATVGTRLFAAENWTTTAQGSYQDFYTTGNTTTSSTRRGRIHQNGVWAIGNTSTTYVSSLPSGVTPLLQINGTGAGGGSQLIGLWGSAITTPATLYLIKSRGGTVGVQGAVNSGDIIGRIQAIADDGTDFSLASNRMEWGTVEDQTPTAKGAYWDLWVTPATTTTPVRAMRAFDSGRIGLGTTSDNGSDRLQVAGSVSITSTTYLGSRTWIGNNTTIVGPNSTSAFLQINGTTGNGSSLEISNWSAATTPPAIMLLKSRGTTVGTAGAISSGDFLGRIEANGDDGTDFSTARNRLEWVATEAYSATNKGCAWDLYLTANGTVAAVRAVRFTGSLEMLVGNNNATALTVGADSATPRAQFTGSNNELGSQVLIARFSADANPARLYFAKSRNNTWGTNTAVNNAQDIGSIEWCPADGTDFTQTSAKLKVVTAENQSTTAQGCDMVAYTTPKTTTTLTEGWRLKDDGTFLLSTRLRLTSIAAGSTNGDVWLDSTQKTISAYPNGQAIQLQGVIFTSTASATVANTTSETSIIGSGVGSLTLAANALVAGKTVRLRIRGYVGDTSTPNLTIKAHMGATAVWDSGAVALVALTGNNGFECEVVITCRTTGSSGTVFAQGAFVYYNGTTVLALGAPKTGTTTINTTTTQALEIKATWGTANASNTITGSNCTVEILN